ncbi:hypothetical protein DFH28DRAFT_1172299 [Melampsora americana]|nr:hypothetical protein DFH28DRAFT_1172299 [Melampsora americana]
MNQTHLHHSKRRQSSSSLAHGSKSLKLSSLPRRAYSLAQGKQNMLGHLNHTRVTSLTACRPSVPSCEPCCDMTSSSPTSTTSDQNLGKSPPLPDHPAQALPNSCTPHSEGSGNKSHGALCENRASCDKLETTKFNLIEDPIISKILTRAKPLKYLPDKRVLSTTLVERCHRTTPYGTLTALQRKSSTIIGRRTQLWSLRRWKTDPRAGILNVIDQSLCIRRPSDYDQESHGEGLEVNMIEENDEPHKIHRRESLEESPSRNGDHGERSSEHEVQSRASVDLSESSLSSLSSSESEESHFERSQPAGKLRKVAVTSGTQAEIQMAKRNPGLRNSCDGQPPVSRLSHSLSADSKTRSSSRKQEVSDDESESEVQRQTSSCPRKNRTFLQKSVLTSRQLNKSFPAAFKSPMINSTKDKKYARSTTEARSLITRHDDKKASQDPSKLKGILLTKKVVELEHTLTLMMDAERILKTSDIQSVMEAKNKNAAEYLFKVSRGARSSTQTGRSGGYEAPTTTPWGDTWGFMAPVSDAAPKNNEQEKLEISQRDYVSEDAADDLPDDDSLFAENSIRKYDCSGALIDGNDKSVKSTSKSIIRESACASTINCAPRTSNLGNMMQDMGIEPSALGWDSEEEDWKD